MNPVSLKSLIVLVTIASQFFQRTLVAGDQSIIIQPDSGSFLGTYTVGPDSQNFSFTAIGFEFDALTSFTLRSSPIGDFSVGELFAFSAQGPVLHINMNLTFYGNLSFSIALNETLFLEGVFSFPVTPCALDEHEMQSYTIFRDRVCETVGSLKFVFELEYAEFIKSTSDEEYLAGLVLDELLTSGIDTSKIIEISISAGSIVFEILAPSSIIADVKLMLSSLVIAPHGVIVVAKPYTQKESSTTFFSNPLYLAIAIGGAGLLLLIAVAVLFAKKRVKKDRVPSAADVFKKINQSQKRLSFHYVPFDTDGFSDVNYQPTPGKPPREWTHLECLGWLKVNGLSFLIPGFKKSHFTGSEMLTLRRDHPMLASCSAPQVERIFGALDLLWFQYGPMPTESLNPQNEEEPEMNVTERKSLPPVGPPPSPPRELSEDAYTTTSSENSLKRISRAYRDIVSLQPDAGRKPSLVLTDNLQGFETPLPCVPLSRQSADFLNSTNIRTPYPEIQSNVSRTKQSYPFAQSRERADSNSSPMTEVTQVSSSHGSYLTSYSC